MMARHRARDEQELRNSLEVMAWIEHLVTHPEVPINLDLICHFNRLILQKTDRDFWAGRIRSAVDWQQPEEWNRRRAIIAPDDEAGLVVADRRTGEIIVRFPPDAEVGPRLAGLLEWLNSETAARQDPIVRSALFHQQFTAIHPFRDGNGRTARAIVTLILRRAGFRYEVLSLQRVLDERRDEYIATLRAADAGDVTGWVRFFARAVLAAVEAARRRVDAAT